DRAVIDRPYSLGFATVGALYERPQSISCGKPRTTFRGRPGANYGEGCGAESRADFIHKLRIVLKEPNETAVWLQLILESSLLSPDSYSSSSKSSSTARSFASCAAMDSISGRRASARSLPNFSSASRLRTRMISE